MGRFRKSSATKTPFFKGKHRFEHWYRDNTVYFITSRCRDRFPAFKSEQAKLIFWDRFDHYAEKYSFIPWVTTLLDNHYHTVGYLSKGENLGPFMQHLHGSVAKLVNDLLPTRHVPFFRRSGNQDYFDGCLRDETQARRAYRYTLLQAVRAGLVKDHRAYAHTHVNIDLDRAVKRALEKQCFLPTVPYARYREVTHILGIPMHTTPTGDLADRIRLTHDRLLSGTNPSFSDAFVLADVVLDPNYRRRFDNFSGDLSGRFVGALALCPPGDVGATKRVATIVDNILAQQRPDGRFGDASLVFDRASIDRPHMALLWGNGRLLVGLLEYHAVHPTAVVLDAAIRLAGFLDRVCDVADEESLNAKLGGAGAYGFVCLTQCNEGLVLLYRATGDPRWLTLAQRVSRWLKPPGTQHSHGVLTTLRGQMMIYDATRDPADLQTVRHVYDDIIKHGDALVFGGVPEYFGGLTNAEVIAHSGGKPRDEGCSEADFVRLSLQLWRATGEMDYLDRAEHCLLNHLLANQYDNGDFGHRVISHHGFEPAESPGRAWWCCTMHGLRAFPDILDAAIHGRPSGEMVTVDLFIDARWANADTTVELCPLAANRCRLTVQRAPAAGVRLRVRQPRWSGPVELTSEGKAMATRPTDDGYLTTIDPIQGPAVIDIRLSPITRLITRLGDEVQPVALDHEPIEAALFHGPLLMGVSADADPGFFGEPWPTNTIRLPADPVFDWKEIEPTLTVTYQHDGYPEPQTTSLHPAGGRSRNTGRGFAVWLRWISSRSA